MSSRNPRAPKHLVFVVLLIFAGAASAQEEASDMPSTADRPQHGESAAQHDEAAPEAPEIEPAIPAGMTLEEVFNFAESSPPANFPEPVPDDKIYAFTMFEQLEYRVANDETDDPLGWEAQGWIGGDFHRFWWKNEGEAVFDGPNEGETETDLLYSRLSTPFWNLQAGVQYANEWHEDDYEDRWSGVVALQGLAPYMFELDNSLYLSEDGDATLAIEAEYDIRITQRLVLQPRTEIGFAFQDIAERSLGAGMTSVKFDLRLRYEIKREFAPYLGVRSRFLVGETEDIARARGVDSDQFFFMAGLRFAF